MGNKQIKERIKEVIDSPGVSLEKGVKKGWDVVKEVGKNEKIINVVDNPGIALEKGVKKGLDALTKKLKEEEEEEKENYDQKYETTRMVIQKNVK